jgi:hypothetical protein
VSLEMPVHVPGDILAGHSLMSWILLMALVFHCPCPLAFWDDGTEFGAWLFWPLSMANSLHQVLSSGEEDSARTTRFGSW